MGILRENMTTTTTTTITSECKECWMLMISNGTLGCITFLFVIIGVVVIIRRIRNKYKADISKDTKSETWKLVLEMVLALTALTLNIGDIIYLVLECGILHYFDCDFRPVWIAVACFVIVNLVLVVIISIVLVHQQKDPKRKTATEKTDVAKIVSIWKKNESEQKYSNTGTDEVDAVKVVVVQKNTDVKKQMVDYIENNKDLKESTKKDYKRKLTRYFDFCGEKDYPPLPFSSEIEKEYKKDLECSSPLKENTIESYLAVIRRLNERMKYPKKTMIKFIGNNKESTKTITNVN